MKLCEIRKEGEKFIAELGKFYLLGGSRAGKEKGTVKEIYDKYQYIFTKENISLLKNSIIENPKRENKYLLSFVIQGYLGSKTYPFTEEIVKTEMSTSVNINKSSISLRYATLLIPAENDREKRLELDQYLGMRQKELNPLRENRVIKLKETSKELGYDNHIKLIEEMTNTKVEILKSVAKRFLEGTDEVYSFLIDNLQQNFLNTGDRPLAKSDISYIFKTNSFDKYFPEIEMVPSVEDTMFGMGINIHKQNNITMYFEKEEGKTSKSFCCPVKIPEEIYLSFNPRGGLEDYQSSLHEAGHCQYYANMEKHLPFEFKRLGDKAIGEGYAFLFQFLTTNKSWIEKFLDIPQKRKSNYELFVNGYQLYIIRRFCGKLLYELEVFSQENDTNILKEKYVSIMEHAVKVKVNPNNYLLDLDLGFNTPYYIKAWIFEAYLREYLENNFGGDWFSTKEAGDALKAIWKNGQSYECDEIVLKLGFFDFDVQKLIDQYRWINKLEV